MAETPEAPSDNPEKQTFSAEIKEIFDDQDADVSQAERGLAMAALEKKAKEIGGASFEVNPETKTRFEALKLEVELMQEMNTFISSLEEQYPDASAKEPAADEGGMEKGFVSGVLAGKAIELIETNTAKLREKWGITVEDFKSMLAEFLKMFTEEQENGKPTFMARFAQGMVDHLEQGDVLERAQKFFDGHPELKMAKITEEDASVLQQSFRNWQKKTGNDKKTLEDYLTWEIGALDSKAIQQGKTMTLTGDILKRAGYEEAVRKIEEDKKKTLDALKLHGAKLAEKNDLGKLLLFLQDQENNSITTLDGNEHNKETFVNDLTNKHGVRYQELITQTANEMIIEINKILVSTAIAEKLKLEPDQIEQLAGKPEFKLKNIGLTPEFQMTFDQQSKSVTLIDPLNMDAPEANFILPDGEGELIDMIRENETVEEKDLSNDKRKEIAVAFGLADKENHIAVENENNEQILVIYKIKRREGFPKVVLKESANGNWSMYMVESSEKELVIADFSRKEIGPKVEELLFPEEQPPKPQQPENSTQAE